MSGVGAALVRAVSGIHSVWLDSRPSPEPAVYFANHASHLDFVVIWAALPGLVRRRTQPVAAADYWNATVLRRCIARRIRAILIERREVSRQNNPLAPMLAVLEAGGSLILFPEGRRNTTEPMLPFQAGLYHLARKRPGLRCVPVYLENLNRILPRGEILPVPLLGSVTFGPPISLNDRESKADFLARARSAVERLRPT